MAGDDVTGRPGLSGAELRRRAAAGVAAVGVRQVGIRVLALGGTIVLARLLLPRDFGAVAIGTTLVSIFSFAGDAGIGAGMIRGPREPERADLRSFLGLELLVSLVLAGVTAAVGLELGVVGRVTALMVASLPIAAFRMPGVILYERRLRYQPLVVIELLETVVFYAWAVGAVLAGFGVWGLASATPARAAFGAVLITLWSPAGFVVPGLDWSRIRGLLAFGVKYQAVNAVTLGRDQGVNLGTAAIGGVAVLGLWSLAFRIMQVPFLLFEAVWRVSFPAMARLMEAGEEPLPIIERGLGLAALITGVLLAALVGSSPALVPVVFGHQWTAAGSVIPFAALGLMFGGPVSVATAGYLYAAGDAGSVLFSAIVQALAWFGVTFALLRPLGVEAVGVGWLVASVAEAVVLVSRTKRHIPLRVGPQLWIPAAMGAVAALVGWMAASQLGPTLPSVVAGGIVATILYSLLALLLRRALVIDAIQLARRSLGSLVT